MSKQKVKYYKTFETDQSAFMAEEPIAVYLSASSPLNYIQMARKGVTVKTLLSLSDHLSFSLNELASILHISLRTLQRYAPDKLLDSDASAKALQLATLRTHGISALGSESAFNDWLREEVPALDSQKPIDLLDTPYGFQLLDQILGRIEHGIFA